MTFNWEKMKLHSIMLIVLSAFSIPACSDRADMQTMPDVLKIGILPDESEAELLRRYTPLFHYLSDKLDITYSLVIPASYQDLLDQFATGNIDLAYFGGFTFILAHDKYDAKPLVMRDVDTRFTSYFIVKSDNKSTKLDDFKSKRFSFGSKLSTSGHLMPRYFLKQKEIVPEEYFTKVEYSGAHDKTVYSVRDDNVDIGVTNAKIFDKMLQDKRISFNEVRILMESPPYPDYVWVLQNKFDPLIQTKIQNVFLSLSPANSEHAKIFSGLDAGGFLPAAVSDFQYLHDISHELGLIQVNKRN